MSGRAGVAQVVTVPALQCEALSSNLSTAKKKKKKKKERTRGC
jgi:hypothetical protein